MTKLKDHDLVTVRKVREANTRIISRSHATGRFLEMDESDGRRTLNLTRESIATAGREAMRKLKAAG